MTHGRRMAMAGMTRRAARGGVVDTGSAASALQTILLDALDAAGSWVAQYPMDAEYLTVSVADITAAEDATGNGYDLSAAGAPQYNTSGMGTQSRPYAGFDGSDDGLVTTSFLQVNGTYPSTFGFGKILTFTSGGSYHAAFSRRVGQYIAVNSSDEIEAAWRPSTGLAIDTTYANTGTAIYGIQCDSTGNHNFRLDGGAPSPQDFNSGGTSTDTSTDLRIGFENTGANFLQSDWGFWGVPSGAVDDTFRAAIESALNTYFDG